MMESYSIRVPSHNIVYRSSLTSKLMGLFYQPFARQASLVAWLPGLAAGGDLPTLQRAIFAASFTLGGLSMKDKSLCVEADNYYGLVLTQLRRDLSKIEGIRSVASVEMICVSVLLAWYAEISSWDTAVACQHIFGASRMICTREPADFMFGLAHSAFRVVRFMTVRDFLLR